MGSYAIFYQLNQPVILHFQEFQFDYYSAVPSATVILNSKQNQWKPLIEGIEDILPDARILRPRQAYYVELSLKLPESQLNVDSGMFGVVVDLYGSSNETSTLLATSRRSLRFPYRSPLVRTAASMVSLPTLLFHFVDEVQTVKDNVFRHVLESERYKLYAVVVKLLETVEVVAAEVRVGEEFTSLQEIIRTWFWSCFLVGSMIFALLYFVAYHTIILLCLSNRDEPPCDLNVEEFSTYNNSVGTQYDQATASRQTEEQEQDTEPEFDSSPEIRRATVRPPQHEVDVPDEFGDGSDGEWEDLSVVDNESRTIRSEPIIQTRSITSNDLHRYLSADSESEDFHPFLVFMSN